MSAEFCLGTPGAHPSPPRTGISVTYCLSSYIGMLKDWVTLGLQTIGEDCFVSRKAEVKFQRKIFIYQGVKVRAS